MLAAPHKLDVYCARMNKHLLDKYSKISGRLNDMFAESEELQAACEEYMTLVATRAQTRTNLRLGKQTANLLKAVRKLNAQLALVQIPSLR